jgi:hypothetical protein
MDSESNNESMYGVKHGYRIKHGEHVWHVDYVVVLDAAWISITGYELLKGCSLIRKPMNYCK